MGSKYEEALERCKKEFDFSNLAYSHEEIRQRLERVFPELRESEDERIRKALIQNLKERFGTKGDMGEGLYMPDVLAWLEKQSEQSIITDVFIKAGLKTYKDDDKWCVLAGDNIQDGVCGFGDTIDEALFEFFKKLTENKSEQKPYPETLDKAIELYYYSYGNGKGGFNNLSLEKFKDITKTFVDDYGGKSAWSEEDEHTSEAIIKEIEANKKACPEYDEKAYDMFLSWLKSIKERMKGE